MANLIDTSVLVDLERRGLAATALVPHFPGQFFVSTITASELLDGVHLADSAERQQRRRTFVEQVLAWVQTLPFDLEVARVHARLRSDLRSAGITVGPYDLQIAATAVWHDLALVTHDVREFERIPGLAVRRFSA